MNTQKQIYLIVALFFIFVGGCTAYTIIEPVRNQDQADWQNKESIERGALLYANNCRNCHGIRGAGSIGPALNKPEFKNQDPLVLRANRELIRRTLYCGRAGTLMPAWLNTNGGALNRIQIEHLIDLITAPADAGYDADTAGPEEAANFGWEEAVVFAENLNRETAALVGGDTLDTIARQHGIGPKELAALNNLPVEGVLKPGTTLRIPGFKADPDGYDYKVYNDNETITKVAESQRVGALILADLNNKQYTFNEKRGQVTFNLQRDGQTVPGLFPGETLQLPEGAVYVVAAEDTLQAIADRHNIPVSAITSNARNRALLNDAPADEPLPGSRELRLPRQTYVVAAGDTIGSVAQLHGVDAEALATSSGKDENAVLQGGEAITLPQGARYAVQANDTWQSVAARHQTTPQDLASLNGDDPNSALSPDIVLALPKINEYEVGGQSLEEVAAGYANVTAESLAEANGIEDPASRIAISTSLALPEDAYGTAPATDAINPGTACVQYTIPNSIFEREFGAGGDTAIEPPEQVSTSVEIIANANDWVVVADGQSSAPNQGVVKVRQGTQINFRGAVGLHTITVNDKKDNGDLRQGETRNLTFPYPAGNSPFTIKCDYHPDMVATVFVE